MKQSIDFSVEPLMQETISTTKPYSEEQLQLVKQSLEKKYEGEISIQQIITYLPILTTNSG